MADAANTVKEGAKNIGSGALTAGKWLAARPFKASTYITLFSLAAIGVMAPAAAAATPLLSTTATTGAASVFNPVANATWDGLSASGEFIKNLATDTDFTKVGEGLTIAADAVGSATP